MAIWAVSLLTGGASPPQSNCRTALLGIRSLIGPVSLRTIRTFQCSTPQRNIRRKPESSFGENQLLQRSISFSLQPTSHPKILHNLRVRPSLTISGKFSLLMGSSRCFGSDMYDKRAIHTRFRCGSGGLPRNQAVHINSLAHSSIGTLSRSRTSPTPCRHAVSDLFHSPHRGSFHLSLTVLVHYRSEEICSLTS
jgi:hypothetical protein